MGFLLLSTSATLTYNCSDTIAFPNVNITASPDAPSNYCVCKDGHFWFKPSHNADIIPAKCAQCFWRNLIDETATHTNN
jgi:ankyrin repeat protein